MTVDTTKIRPGDTVSLVTLRVKEISKGGVYVHVWLDDTSSFPMRPDQIAAHHPRELQVGDRVRLINGGYSLATVKGLDDSGEAWVLWDSGAGWSSLPAERFAVVEPAQ